MVAVEVRSSPSIDGYFEEFVRAALVNREGIAIYIAVPREKNGEEIALPASFVYNIRAYGVGLYLVFGGKLEENEKAVRCCLRFSIPPGRSVGKYQGELDQAVKKFNRGGNLDATRDLTETVEAAIGDLALKAASKRLIAPTCEEVEAMGFEKRIDVLSAPNWGTPSWAQTRFFDENLKLDLKSFKGARILSHHPRSRQAQASLETQYLERMEAGVRLLRETVRRLERCTRRGARG